MIIKIAVVGCRHYNNYSQAKDFIDQCICMMEPTATLVFISGKCSGADMLGERYAEENGATLEYYPADWKKYGRAAGPIRNRQIVTAADYIICFWDGKSKGTRSVIKYAEQFEKTIYIKFISI